MSSNIFSLDHMQKCSDCSMVFDTDEDLVNHKEMFCINSKYYDPEDALESVGAGNARKAIKFEDVKKYIAVRDEADISKGGRYGIGKQSLSDLKKTIPTTDIDHLKDILVKKKEMEKADELRRFKVKQQKLKETKKLEEVQLGKYLEEVVVRKNEELRAKIEQEQIRKQLNAADQSKLTALEEEKKRELNLLAKERESLLSMEETLKNDIDSLTESIRKQERILKEKETQLEDNMDQERELEEVRKRKKVMGLAHQYGETSSNLAKEKMILEKQRQEIIEKMPSLGESPDENAYGLNNLRNAIEFNVKKIETMKDDKTNNARFLKQQLDVVDKDIKALQPTEEYPSYPLGAKGFMEGFLKEDLGNNISKTNAVVHSKHVLPLDIAFREIDSVTKEMVGEINIDGISEDKKVSIVMPPSNNSNTFTKTNDLISPPSGISRNYKEKEVAVSPPSLTVKSVKINTNLPTGMTPKSNIKSQGRQHLISPIATSNNSPPAPDQILLQKLDALEQELARHKEAAAAASNLPKYVPQTNESNTPNNSGYIPPVNYPSPYNPYGAPPNPPINNPYSGTAAPSFNPYGYFPPPNNPYFPPNPYMYSFGYPPLQHHQSPQQNQYQNTNNISNNISEQFNVMQQDLENQKLQSELDRLVQEMEEKRARNKRRELSKITDLVFSKLGSLNSAPTYNNNVGSNNNSINNNSNSNMDNGSIVPSNSSNFVDNSGGINISQSFSMLEDPSSIYSPDELRLLNQLQILPKDSELYELNMNHLKELAELKHEMESLEQKRKVEEMKAKIEEDAIMRQNDIEKKKWLDQQKRDLYESTIRKKVAKEAGSDAPIMLNTSNQFDPSRGFFLFFDFIGNMASRFSVIQISYNFYNGSEPISKLSKLKSISHDIPEGKYDNCIVGVSRQVVDSLITVNPKLRCFIKIEYLKNERGVLKPQDIGWTFFDVFGGNPLILQTGYWKAPIFTGPINVAINNPNTLPRLSETDIYIRVVNVQDYDMSNKLAVDPSKIRSLYVPTISNLVPENFSAINKDISVSASNNTTHLNNNNIINTNAGGDMNGLKTSDDKQDAIAMDNVEIILIIKDLTFKENVTYKLVVEVFVSNSVKDLSTLKDIESKITKLQIIDKESTFIWDEQFNFNNVKVDVNSCWIFKLRDENNQEMFWAVSKIFNANKSLKNSQLLKFNPFPLPANLDISSLPTLLPNDENWQNKLSFEAKLNLKSGDRGNSTTNSNGSRPSSNVVGSNDLADIPIGEEEEKIPDPFIQFKSPIVNNTPFVKGDSFNVYIDGCRGLPDNTTITRVTAKIFTSDMVLVGKPFIGYSGSNDNVFEPIYEISSEFKAEQFNPTSVVLVKIDTIELYSKVPQTIGYAILNVFAKKGDIIPPESPDAQEFCLNKGCFQVPIFRCLLTKERKDLAFNSLNEYKKIPCGTLLLRIMPAVPLDSSLIVEDKYLPSKRPNYNHGVYDSTRAIPKMSETMIYKKNETREKQVVKNILTKIELPDMKPPVSGSDADIQKWIEKRMEEPPKALINLETLVTYNPEAGFGIYVDGVHNLKVTLPVKVIYCLSPPASFYQDPKLTSDVEFTKQYNWEYSVKSPSFVDDIHKWTNELFHEKLVIILHVKSLTLKKDVLSLQDIGWTILPVFNDFGFVRHEALQLPLFTGQPTREILKEMEFDPAYKILTREAVKGKKGTLQYLPGQSLHVRIIDTQMIDFVDIQTSREKYDAKFISPELLKEHSFVEAKVVKDKKLSSLLPSKKTVVKDFEKQLNVEFAKSTDILHYSFSRA